MKTEEIQDAFVNKKFRYTKHGLEQRIKRDISAEEIEQTIMSSEIIENYTFDKYGPSCLLCGRTLQDKYLHIQIALLPIISIVTVYEPEPDKWINNKIRRR